MCVCVPVCRSPCQSAVEVRAQPQLWSLAFQLVRGTKTSRLVGAQTSETSRLHSRLPLGTLRLQTHTALAVLGCPTCLGLHSGPHTLLSGPLSKPRSFMTYMIGSCITITYNWLQSPASCYRRAHLRSRPLGGRGRRTLSGQPCLHSGMLSQPINQSFSLSILYKLQTREVNCIQI